MTDSDAPPSQLPTEPAKPKREIPQWAPLAGVLALILVSGIAAGIYSTVTAKPKHIPSAFEKADPEGYAACKVTADGRTSTNGDVKTESIFASARHAKNAKDPAIRAAVFDTAAAGLVNAPDFTTTALEPACEANGFQMPSARPEKD
jgi:hypothetical protein